MTEHDPNYRRLEDLGRAVHLAMRHSSELASAVERLRREGFSLYLVLEPSPAGQAGHRFEIRPATPVSDREAPATPAPTITALQPVSPPRRPEFRLDADDVQLLHSMGIDATRPGRRRR